MEFEYDHNKSRKNKEKHGIDFETAQAIWQDQIVELEAIYYFSEPRFLIVGKLETVYWTAIVTYRGEATRIISVRRSRDKEVTIYEKKRTR